MFASSRKSPEGVTKGTPRWLLEAILGRQPEHSHCCSPESGSTYFYGLILGILATSAIAVLVGGGCGGALL